MAIARCRSGRGARLAVHREPPAAETHIVVKESMKGDGGEGASLAEPRVATAAMFCAYGHGPKRADRPAAVASGRRSSRLSLSWTGPIAALPFLCNESTETGDLDDACVVRSPRTWNCCIRCGHYYGCRRAFRRYGRSAGCWPRACRLVGLMRARRTYGCHRRSSFGADGPYRGSPARRGVPDVVG